MSLAFPGGVERMGVALRGGAVLWERIHDHLEGLRTRELTERDPWPEAATPDGIARATDVRPARARNVLREMLARGRIERMMAHVDGERRRRYVYRVSRRSTPASTSTHPDSDKAMVRCVYCGRPNRVRLVPA